MRTCQGGDNVEDDVREESVDRGGPSVHDTEHLARLAPQVPTEAQGVQVRE